MLPTSTRSKSCKGTISMTIYLYVKTHNKTGLKYLGQTTAKDPHKYPGSGVYWKLHLEKHGYDYTTEIISECQTKDEIKELGIYYSNLWNIVESDEWANLKIEQGDGGRQSEEVRRKIGKAGKGRIPWNKGKQIWAEDEKRVIGERNRLRGPQSPETIAKRVSKTTEKKRSACQLLNMSNGHKNRSHISETTKLKMRESRRLGILEGRIIPHNRGKKFNVPSATAKHWKIIHPDGKEEIVLSLRKWCITNNINYQIMHRNLKLQKPYKNYVVSESFN